MTAGRYELVARDREYPWVIPMSCGRHFRRTYLGAWWTARRWTRRGTQRLRWEVRPALTTRHG